MKKLIALLVCFAMCLPLALSVSAASDNNSSEDSVIRFYDENGNEIPSVEYTDEEMLSMLPADVYDAFYGTPSLISTCGVNPPNSNNIWNFPTRGRYFFTADFNVGTIYSQYCFIGHGGSVTLITYCSSPDTGVFSASIYVKTSSGGTRVAGGWMKLNGESVIYATGLSSSDIVYFGLHSPAEKDVKLDIQRSKFIAGA